MWGGRFSSAPEEIMQLINCSIDFDKRLYVQDIFASKVHVRMLANEGIIDKNSGIKIQKGMVLAIEPMLALGSIENHEDEDQWTVVMTDHSLAAHFEETVAITDDKPYILTKKENNGE